MYYNGDILVGTIIICGTDGEDLDDLPETLGLTEWKLVVDTNMEFMNRWRGE